MAAFDATDPDETLAHRAKVNFAQCCIWLRDFSASWPAASAHKVFFEGLIQGGLRISSGDLEPETTSPDQPAFSPETPNMPEELRVMGRNLSTGRGSSIAGATPATVSGTPGSTAGAPASAQPLPDALPTPGPSLFQLPQFYWNHLTTVPMGEAESGEAPEQRWEWDLDLAASQSGTTPDNMPPPPLWDADSTRGSISAGTHGGYHPPAQEGQGQSHASNASNAGHDQAQGQNGGASSNDAESFISPNHAWAGAPVIGPHSGPQDQAAIYAALMSYMMEAAKTR